MRRNGVHQVMASVQPNDAHVKELVAKFIEIGTAQYRAAYVIDTARYNRLYKAMQHIRAELRSMPGDQRRALRPLLVHSNVQVRLMAANTLLGIDPQSARRTLEGVRDSGIQPQCADASGMIHALDDGSFIPT